MSTQERARGARVDAWLASGGVVLAATERAARSVARAFHAARRAEGLTAWPTPSIHAWESWVRDRWTERNQSGLVLLNPLQEQALWAAVIRASDAGAGMLHADRLAAAALRAYRLLAAYAPAALQAPARLGWSEDAAVFSGWIADFEARCRRESMISPSLVTVELTRRFASQPAENSPPVRPPLLLIGFDRLLKTQIALLDSWGEWRQDEPEPAPASPLAHFYATEDESAELAACVSWLRQKRQANPKARLMVVATDLQARRGQLERALLSTPASPQSASPALDFEFSLGVPLSHVAVARSGLLLLRWLHEPLAEPELDSLLGSGSCTASEAEELALAEAMRRLRRHGQERPEWSLADFAARTQSNPLAAGWTARILAARNQLTQVPARQSPLDWVRIAGLLLDGIGWPGFRPLASAAFQARQRWEKTLESCGSLGLDAAISARGMDWPEFVSTVAAAIAGTIFATESTDAAVQITEPLESAGQLADAIWFLGAHEESWPARGQPNPLLPLALQREAGMPHSSPQADWTLAQQATARLLASADEVIFSFAHQAAETESRPSRLILQALGTPKPLPAQLAKGAQEDHAEPQTETFADSSQPPFPQTALAGGSGTLTRQSKCPFQAFGMARLAADDWDPAEFGLNARQRGQLLHEVLHRVWGGAPRGGISSLQQLLAVPDLRAFVSPIVDAAIHASLDPESRNPLPDRFPARLLALEAERLTGLVSEWLAYETRRLPFTVAGTEVPGNVTVAGLTLNLRLDRVDLLPDGGKLVIDYKTGLLGPSAWNGKRPDDVQLPLYATFAVAGKLEGLVFARLRAGEVSFYGRVRDAQASLLPDLKGRNGLVNNPLTQEQLDDWRTTIEQLGQDFLAGNAAVDPKDGSETCDTCHLHSVCRICENQSLAALEDGDDSEDESDEPGEPDA